MTQDNKKADTRDHGGGIDAAIAQYGGARNDWIDLSTGINPNPYPLPNFQSYHWTQLPDRAAFDALMLPRANFGRSQQCRNYSRLWCICNHCNAAVCIKGGNRRHP